MQEDTTVACKSEENPVTTFLGTQKNGSRRKTSPTFEQKKNTKQSYKENPSPRIVPPKWCFPFWFHAPILLGTSSASQELLSVGATHCCRMSRSSVVLARPKEIAKSKTSSIIVTASIKFRMGDFHGLGRRKGCSQVTGILTAKLSEKIAETPCNCQRYIDSRRRSKWIELSRKNHICAPSDANLSRQEIPLPPANMRARQTAHMTQATKALNARPNVKYCQTKVVPPKHFKSKVYMNVYIDI